MSGWAVLTAVLTASAVAVGVGGTPAGRRRLHRLALSGARPDTRPGARSGPRPPGSAGGAARVAAVRSRWRGPVAAAAVVGLAGLALAGAGGAALGVAAVPCWALIVRRRRRDRPLPPGDLGLALDLVSACLAAGVPVPVALRAAAEAVGDAVGRSLSGIARALADGAAPEEAWRPWLDDPAARAAARALVRAAASGAAPADVVARAAARQREAVRARAERRVRAAGAWSVLPLGLCFLPAFVLVGVVPLIVGLVATVR